MLTADAVVEGDVSMENITEQQIKNFIDSFYKTSKGRRIKRESDAFMEWFNAQGKGFQEKFQKRLKERYSE